MEIIKNLICFENDKASVIRLKSDNLEFIKKDGEIEFPITIDFWEWWKRVVSYIEGDYIDICFVYDKNYDLLQENEITRNNIINFENSSWKLEHIKSYFWELKPTYINIVIVGSEEQEYALNGGKGVISRRFYTNLNFNVLNTKKNSSKTDGEEANTSQIAEDEYTEFAKYFVDLIRRERG